MTITYYEKIDDRSPSTASFSMYGSRASVQLILPNASLTNALLIDLLGDTETGEGGKLRRKLPKAHPRWPWLYASRIENVVGVGPMTKTAAVTGLFENANVLDAYAAYEQVMMTVVFEPRPYAVVSDDVIDTDVVDWTDEMNASHHPGYAKEWLRYTSYTVHPQTELLTARQGQSVFRLTNSTTLDSPQAPHLNTIPAFPRMTVPKAALKVRWHQVPFNFVDSPNSYIFKALGRLNYNDWFGCDAGSLLYEAVGVSEPYVPAVPAVDQIAGEAVYATYKLCDLEFVFQYTDRTAGFEHTLTVSNPNWKVAGHNLLPWLYDKRFYYVTAPDPSTGADNTKWTPTFLSYPFELLFTNPDT